MFLQRLIVLLTGAFVSLCLGLGLMMMAMGPKEKATDAPGLATADNEPRQIASRKSEPPAPAQPESRPPEPGAASAQDLAEARKQIEAAIAAAPDYARFFKRLHEAFPGEHDAALDAFASRLAGSTQIESVDFYVSEGVRRLRQSRGVLAAKAEAAPLARVFDVQLEVLRAIAKEDVRLCVGFLYGGASPDFQKFAATKRALIADMALAGVEAIASGQGKKIERSAPTDADFRQLEAALLAKGLGKLEIDALLDGKMPDPPLEDAQMCAAGQTYLEVLHAMPEAARLRIYGLAVELMARS